MLNLEDIGLNKKEAQVYLSLLELGESSIQRLSEKSKIKRTTLYDVIATLKEKALVGITSRKSKKYYYAEDPRKIEGQIEEKKEKFLRMLPELLSVCNFIDRKPKIRYFEGMEGIKEVYRDTLNYPKSETMAWASPEVATKFDFEWLKSYIAKRVEKKIWQRALFPDLPALRGLKDDDQKQFRKTLMIPPQDFPFDVEINLYAKSKIGFMSFEEQIGLIVESPKIYNTLKSVFEMNWKLFEKTN
ncbi:MAG: helix-turn-helix domain-containing protein [Patescibacteria group bacterium]|jgi:sugar-specific transcriptional regulator TrmB